MSEIAIIGSSMMEELITIDAVDGKTTNTCTTNTFASGDMRTLAQDVAQLGFQCVFCTKYGNDLDGIEMWNTLYDLHIPLFGPTLELPTQKVVSIKSGAQQRKLYNTNPAFEFNEEDLIPYPAFASCQFGITDVSNSTVLLNMLQKTPAVKWIVSKAIPPKAAMPYVYGLILTPAEILKLGNPKEVDRICYRLCALGAKWVLIYLEDKGVYLYRNGQGKRYQSVRSGNGNNSGCYSAFLAGLTCNLLSLQSLDVAILLGLQADAVVWKYPAANDDRFSNSKES